MNPNINRRSQWYSPAQSFNHELNVVKGWPSPYAIDKTLEIDANQPTINAGRVVSINPTTGNMVLGCTWSTTVAAMPIFAFPNSSDYDVRSDVGNISGGVMLGLVASGAFEIETTEFEGTGFASNTPLTIENNVGARDRKSTRLNSS